MKVIRGFALILAMAALCAAGTASAMKSDSSGGAAQSSEFSEGVKAINAGQWEAAIMKLNAAVAADPKNADAQNYLGYAYRKLGKLDAAFDHYSKALAIDPEHRGAHEYVGEAHLMAGNLAKAEEHLKTLDKLCTFGCDEFYALKDAVAAYRAKTGG